MNMGRVDDFLIEIGHMLLGTCDSIDNVEFLTKDPIQHLPLEENANFPFNSISVIENQFVYSINLDFFLGDNHSI